MSKVTIDYVFDLGGSVVNPGDLDASFLKLLRNFYIGQVKKGKRFALVVGGGLITRVYQNFLKDHFGVSPEDLDRVGIIPTLLNAELIRVILKAYAYPFVLESPYEKIKQSESTPIFVFSGWKFHTGWSTDYVSLLVAKRFGVKEVLSLTNIKGAYEVKRGKMQSGKVIPLLTFDEYQKMIGSEWIPGMKVPFDPIATREARQERIRAVILDGTDLENLASYLEGKEFVGTVIE